MNVWTVVYRLQPLVEELEAMQMILHDVDVLLQRVELKSRSDALKQDVACHILGFLKDRHEIMKKELERVMDYMVQNADQEDTEG